MIIDATTTAQVRTAIHTANEQNLPLAVYATGHGGEMPDPERTVVVTTSAMSTVIVDPRRRIARVGPGARWSEVIEAAAPFGLAPLAGTNATVGVIGYTLGGGMGWLSRAFGYAADSVVRAEVVTADGQTRTVSADQDPDLFWAIRGGGANFGVVTSLEFRLHPVPSVYAGSATFPLERAGDLLTWYRDNATALPDELTANLVLTPDSVAVRGMYAGGAVDARRALAPLLGAAGTPVTDTWRSMSYTESVTVGGTAPRNFTLLADLPDPVITGAVDAVGEGADAVEIRLWSGAIARPDAHHGPAGHRDVPFSAAVVGSPEIAEPITFHGTGGSFLNWLPDPTRTHTAYTTRNYARLRDLKHRYDPNNLFGLAKNIPPAVRETARLGA
ncbi:hypothetical protein BLA60_37795 [Actinophytocola xinjiangensis]|uniref:FAD-binding PCMH-type domain-containing protein n=1 Tax=Actinophytocola xinjiangensis TaxID=485602 RepID=A0A7Z0WEQ8_9PSEU|nr:FAD-binding oxidoreductase [Actinophytocola xinjiangensis]OLF05135.1 hypothetical protein BLA60_37795 [Actinophytocola xinjiangensis]